MSTDAWTRAADTDTGRRAGRGRLRHRNLLGHRLDILAVIATGGAAGALGRYALARALPTRPDAFPWATLITNVTGCLLIGTLMVLITEVWAAHRLARPFLGVGLLGGFTTFSTYADQTRALLATTHPGTGLAYLAGTLVAALLAVQLGVIATRWAARTRRRRR